MNAQRFLTTLRLDMVIQWRSGFYAVAVVVALLVGMGARLLIEPAALAHVLPSVLLLAVGGTAFIYVAGLLVFERDQRTLDALFVSPLRQREYWLARMASLLLLELIEGVILVVAAYGVAGVNWFYVLGGIGLMSALFTLIGVILIVRYDSITDFLMPSLVVTLPLQLPVLYFLGVSPSPAWLLSPASAPAMLLTGGWRALEAWELVYALGFGALVLAISGWWAMRAFNHYVVLGGRE